MARRTIRTLFALHGWAGLASGLLLLLVTLSGSLLLFRHELDPVLYPHRYRVAAADSAAGSLDAVYRAVRRAYPDARVTGIRDLPVQPGKPVTVALQVSNAGGEAVRRVSVNPYTADVFDPRGVREDLGGDFFGWLLQFHYSLQVRPFGDLVVGLLAASLLVSVATGAILYRKHVGRVLRFRVPLRLKNGRAAASSLHRIVGVWSLLFNAMMALTALWILRAVFTPSFYATFDAERTVPPGPAPELRLSLDSLVAQAHARYPAFRCVGITLPLQNGAPIDLYGAMEGDFFLYPNTANTLTFNARTGALKKASLIRNRSMRHKLTIWIPQLHFGQYGGLPLKLIYLLGGLTPSLLSITGFTLWLGRKPSSKRKDRARRRAVYPVST